MSIIGAVKNLNDQGYAAKLSKPIWFQEAPFWIKIIGIAPYINPESIPWYKNKLNSSIILYLSIQILTFYVYSYSA